MASPLTFSDRVFLAVPREEVWAFLSDTERLNRAIALPPVRFVPRSDPAKKGYYDAEARALGMKIAYEELPFDWVAPRYYQVQRKFPGGPLVEVTAGMRFHPAKGGTELEIFAHVRPRNWLGSLAARLAIGKKSKDRILKLVREYEEHVKNPGEAQAPAAPPPERVDPDVLKSRLAAGPLPGPVDRLRAHLTIASDLEVIGMRPYALADRWGARRMEVLTLFLHAARAGVLDLSWNVLCPNCHAPRQSIATLAEMKNEAHCETCEIRFGPDLAASVEARFSVNPAVRRARRETYCIGGPANMPEILAQLRVAPGETRTEALPLPAGAVRIRCYQAPGVTDLAVEEGGSGRLEARCEAEGLKVAGGPLRLGEVTLQVSNPQDREVLFVVERETWRHGAATAAVVTSLQDFRDLFPGEAVAPGEEIGISSLAVLFTDLKGSTELYRRIGDPKAFSFVQNHFRYLVEAVSKHRGGVVKTMGDAVMASFASGRDALEAALEMQRNWDVFRQEQGDYDGVMLKVGVHQGPSIAINNAGKLDYFGTTVNMAARVQAQSQGGDVVLTRALQEDPGVQEVLKSAGVSCETLTVSLKGLEGDHMLVRLRPGREGDPGEEKLN